MNPRIILLIFGVGTVLLGLTMVFVPLLMIVSGWPSWSVPGILIAFGFVAIVGAVVT